MERVPRLPRLSRLPPYAALVLAGGEGRRLGGVDKAVLDVAGEALLDRALAAVSGADAVVVVGPPRTLPQHIGQTRESPAGGGPVAAVSAGLVALAAEGLPPVELVLVLACDMALFDQRAAAHLVSALAGDPAVDAALYTGPDGRRQFLAGAYRAPALTDAIAALGSPAGAAMRTVVAGLTVAEIAAHPDVTLDCDTWPDVERTRKILEDR